MKNNLPTPVLPVNSKSMFCYDCNRKEEHGAPESTYDTDNRPYDFGTDEIETLQSDGFIACDVCGNPLVYKDWKGYIDSLSNNYKELPRDQFSTEHELGASELCMHSNAVTHRPIRVWVNDKGTFAHVLTDHGIFIDGSFHIFESGEVSLA